MSDTPSVVKPEVMHHICTQKIFFAHQSVGYNILEGVTDLTASLQGVTLNIKETRAPVDFSEPVFAHTKIGTNTDAIGKIQKFQKLATGPVGSMLDIAFLKLCYVDITAGSDYRAVFDAYRSAVQEIATVHPELTVVHWTLPLTFSKVTWKTAVKKVLGKKLWESEDNIYRFRYNELVREYYGDSQQVFDLARIESAARESLSVSFPLPGERFESLYSGYTDDGGHLNHVGRKVVAKQLLVFLDTL